MRSTSINWVPLYWFAWFAMYSIIAIAYDGIILGALALNFVRTIFIALCSYIIVDRIINAKLSLTFKVLLSLIITISGVLLNRLFFSYFIYPQFFTPDYSFNFFNAYRILSQSIIYVSGMTGYGAIRYFLNIQLIKKKNQELAFQKKEAELNALRAQLHPHFLFNTLNGIYNEVLKKSDLAADMILKISEILRFMLYECGAELIELNKESKLIKDYIDLEKIRYGNRIQIIENLDESSSSTVKIPPLIFFSLVENAFKHGLSTVAENSNISILLKRSEKDITFNVKNSKSSETSPQQDYQKGIGLKNITKQLDLYFENDYQMDINSSENEYSVNLNIPIK